MSKKKDNQSDIIEFASSSDKPPKKNEGVVSSSTGGVIKLGVEEHKGKKDQVHTILD